MVICSLLIQCINSPSASDITSLKHLLLDDENKPTPPSPQLSYIWSSISTISNYRDSVMHCFNAVSCERCLFHFHHFWNMQTLNWTLFHIWSMAICLCIPGTKYDYFIWGLNVFKHFRFCNFQKIDCRVSDLM